MNDTPEPELTPSELAWIIALLIGVVGVIGCVVCFIAWGIHHE